MINKFFKNWNTAIHQLTIYECLKEKIEGNKVHNLFMIWKKHIKNKLEEKEKIYKIIEMINQSIKRRAFIDWCCAIQAQFLVKKY